MNSSVQTALGSLGAARPAAAAMTIPMASLPYAELSYSLGGEDLMLKRLLKHRISKGGIYLDIGCFSPYLISNTLLFYNFGWRGLCIDANRGFMDEWNKLRPRDKFVHAAISETDGDVTIYRHRKNSGMTRIISDDDAIPAEFGPIGETVPSIRLDSLLSKHPDISDIAFMNIDVEGHELSVVKSNDWRRWRPALVLLECFEFNFEDPYAAPAISYLAEQGYKIHAKIANNVLMVCEKLEA